jgi:hypothetical protein
MVAIVAPEDKVRLGPTHAEIAKNLLATALGDDNFCGS